MKKDIEWLKGRLRMRKLFKPQTEEEIGYNKAIDEFSEYVDQLDEPEVLSEEWIVKNKFEVNGWNEAVHVEDLQNLLVQKQEEQSIKTETVEEVVADFGRSLERLRELWRSMGTE